MSTERDPSVRLRPGKFVGYSVGLPLRAWIELVGLILYGLFI